VSFGESISLAAARTLEIAQDSCTAETALFNITSVDALLIKVRYGIAISLEKHPIVIFSEGKSHSKRW
jgi:hypothetical protein